MYPLLDAGGGGGAAPWQVRGRKAIDVTDTNDFKPAENWVGAGGVLRNFGPNDDFF